MFVEAKLKTFQQKQNTQKARGSTFIEAKHNMF
jgi:hypothetical protein